MKKTIQFLASMAVELCLAAPLVAAPVRTATEGFVINKIAEAIGAANVYTDDALTNYVRKSHTGNVRIRGAFAAGDAQAGGYRSAAFGENSNASGDYAFAVGSEARAAHDYAFVFNGDEWSTYTDHGAGTFNVNPVGGVSGFYIGSETIADIINGCSPTNVYTKTEIDASYGALAGVFQRDTSIGVTNLHANGKIVINANTLIASATGRFSIDRRYAYLDHDGMGIYDAMGRGFYVRTNGISHTWSGTTRTYRWPSADSGTFALDADIASAVANYKPLQEAKSSPAAAATEAYQFVDTISQDTNGVITATKKTMRKATTTAPGMVQLNDNLDSTRTDHAATANAVRKGLAAAEAYTDEAIRERSLGGIWDEALQVWWTPVMSNGSLTYYATTNVNLNAEN